MRVSAPVAAHSSWCAASLGAARQHQPQPIGLQVADLEPRELAQPGAGDRRNLDHQAERAIVRMGGLDDTPHRVVTEDHVPRAMRVR